MTETDSSNELLLKKLFNFANFEICSGTVVLAIVACHSFTSFPTLLFQLVAFAVEERQIWLNQANRKKANSEKLTEKERKEQRTLRTFVCCDRRESEWNEIYSSEASVQ